MVETDRIRLEGSGQIDLPRQSVALTFTPRRKEAALLALDHCYGLPLEEYERYAERIAAVTAEEVREVVQRVIDFNASALATVGP